VFIFHIVGYLNQKEVVGGLSETNKSYRVLMRNRYGIDIKMYPDEVLSIPIISISPSHSLMLKHFR
jgi:hypothetical protein